MQRLVLILLSSLACLGAEERLPGARVGAAHPDHPALQRMLLRVAEFGAVGDGVHDDGPAIVAAFKAAKADQAPSTVLFEKKIYRLGDNPAAWHYFQMNGHEDLIIEGKGATLLCAEGNLAFYFENGRDIVLRGLSFDTLKPTFTQGEIVAMDKSGTIDVRLMNGYPEPPDETFLQSNGYAAHGGGGRHMIIFENGGMARNKRMDNDHLYIRNITRVSAGVFRFHVKEDYLPRMNGMAAGNWISYGFNKVNLPASVVAAKDKSACTYGQIAANRVKNITFEKLDFFSSLNGGIRVSDMPGDVALQEVRMIRKPGTRNLLSTVSDALHLMNIRGNLLIERCVIEAPGDDCLNVGTLLEKVEKVEQITQAPNDTSKALTLRTTDNRYYFYTIQPGDRLQFLDSKAKREIGIATVKKVEFDPRSRIHRVVIDQAMPGIDPTTTLVLNLNQMTSSTVIRGNVMRPYMRNAMLVRAQHMLIEGNELDGTHGGVMGLNFTYSMGESSQLRDIRISKNTITGFQGSGIIVASGYRDQQGMRDTRDLAILDNIFRFGSTKTLRIRGVQNLTVGGNRLETDGKAPAGIAQWMEISDCAEVKISDE